MCIRDRGLLLRVLETQGKAVVAKIAVDSLLGELAGALEVDVLERPVADSALKTAGNTISLPVPAYGLAAVRLTLK